MGFRKNKKLLQSDELKFINREVILNSIEYILQEEYTSPNDFFKLFSIYGAGGMGKSRLSEKIKIIYEKSEIQIYLIQLELLRTNTIPYILCDIRKKFSNTPNFDYAFLQYWQYSKHELPDQSDLNNFCSFLKQKLPDMFVSIPLGIGTFGMVGLFVDIIMGGYEEYCIEDATKDLVQKIPDKMETIISTLIFLLVKDIQAELKNKRFIIIFDSHTTSTQCKSNCMDWLNEFISRFNQGLFIVTSREKLDWFNDDDFDASLVTQVSLDKIDREHIETYLKDLNLTQDIIEKLIEQSDCVPLYLNIALDLYHENKCIRTPLAIGKDIVKDLLRHLNENQEYIVKYLSVVKLFNEQIFENAIEYNKLSTIGYTYNKFNECMVIGYVETKDELSKIHSILADNICSGMDSKTIKKILIFHITALSKRIIFSTISLENKRALIIQSYIEISCNFDVLEESICEILLDLFFFLYDNGYSQSFIDNADIKNNVFKKTSFKFISLYINGICFRTINIDKGYKQLNNIDIDKCNFGKHLKSLQCDKNYLLAILGKYKKAEEHIILFYKSLNINESGYRYYPIGQIYFADMLMLRGKFISALMEFTTIIDSRILTEALEYESNKAIGHIYRYNFIFEKALEYYSRGEVKHNKKTESYFMTVLCEIYCYTKPQRVIYNFKSAEDINIKINNNNNLGKLYYSRAIAEISNKNFKKSNIFIKKSIATFEKTNYPGGTIFALLAKCYLEYSRDGKISKHTKNDIINKINSLDNIYEYLLLPIYIAENDTSKIEEFSKKFEWISYNETCTNIMDFLLKIKKF